MGFTIEDMDLYSEERYRMKFIAGRMGWSNSISWVHLVEDTTIIGNFWGKELAVTTGLGFQDTNRLLHLLDLLLKHHASGVIIQTGKYIQEVPQPVIDFCNENDFPLLTVPWKVYLADMIKEFSIRIFLQGSADEQISRALITAIESPDNQESYRKELLSHFDVDGTFQVVLVTCDGLDSMDTTERRRLSYRIQVYLEQITHNANFFYYNEGFVLAVNALTVEYVQKVAEGMLRRAQKRMPDNPFYIGIGSQVTDISNFHISYKRAKAAAEVARRKTSRSCSFEEMGVERLMYSCSDELLLKEMEQETLAVLEEYDRKHGGVYMDTLRSYLDHNGSIQAVAEETFTHRNTVIYRVNNIKKLLNCRLETPAERLPYQLAFLIYDRRCRTFMKN